ncbi:MAG: hypothetical protein WC728_05255 [Elusimicrobiota bacterium]
MAGEDAKNPARRIKVRGLWRIAAWIFGLWACLVAPKGFYDLFWGEPEANLYAPSAWAFVTREQWARYARFELIYGLCLAALACWLWRYSRLLPETVVSRDAAD